MSDERIECGRCDWRNDKRAIVCGHCGCSLRPSSPVFLSDPANNPRPALDLSPWKPETSEPSQSSSQWTGEVLVSALLICLTLIFWPEIRMWLAENIWYRY